MLTVSSEPIGRVQVKVDRARLRLTELRVALEEFDGTGSSSGQPYQDAFGRWVQRFRKLRDFDPEWELTIGEVAHNARSALDRLVTLMVVANGGSVEEHRGQFPIYDDLGKYQRARDAMLTGVPEPARLLIDAMQPIGLKRVTDHPLLTLAHVSNWDKHRDGHPSASLNRGAAVVVTSGLLRKTTAFEVPDFEPTSAVTSRVPLQDQDNMFDHVPAVFMQEPLRLLDEYRVRDPRAMIMIMPRVGVCFGTERIFYFHLRRVLEFIEDRVVPELTPFVAHQAGTQTPPEET